MNWFKLNPESYNHFEPDFLSSKWGKYLVFLYRFSSLLLSIGDDSTREDHQICSDWEIRWFIDKVKICFSDIINRRTRRKMIFQLLILQVVWHEHEFDLRYFLLQCSYLLFQLFLSSLAVLCPLRFHHLFQLLLMLIYRTYLSVVSLSMLTTKYFATCSVLAIFLALIVRRLIGLKNIQL